MRPPLRRPSRGAVVALGATAAWLVLLSIVGPMTTSVHGDGYYTWLWARSIVFDQDLDFEEDYRICDDPWGLAHTEQGDSINQWNPGPSLFWIPMLAFDVVTGHPQLQDPDPRYSQGCAGAMAERAVQGSILAGLLTILIAFVVARRAFGEGPALFGAIAMGVLTPLTYYATMLLSYGHAASACTGGLVVLAWDRERRRPSRHGWLWMGAATGLAMLTRPQNGVLAILPLCLWLERAWARAREQDLRGVGALVAGGVAYVGATLVVFAPQMLQWWQSQGELFFLPQGRHYMRWSEPRIAQVLFSTSNGLLVWSPILYLAVAGLVLLASRRVTRSLGVPLLIVLAAMTYVNASVFDWWGAIGFPGRRFDSMSVPFAIGIAAIGGELAESFRARRAFTPLALASAVVLLLGVWNTGTQVAVARGSRIDIAHRSDQMWLDVWGRVAHPIWQGVGNPLTWPASLPFAIRHRVSPRMWDHAGGQELFIHDWLSLRRRPEDATFDFVGRHSELLVDFEDEPRAIGGRRARGPEGEHARVFVPLSWPEIGELRFDVSRAVGATGAAHVWLALDDEDLGTHRVDPDTRELRVPVRARHPGIAELRIRVVGDWVGFSTMEIRDRDPSPQEREAPHLSQLAARRRAWQAARREPSSGAP